MGCGFCAPHRGLRGGGGPLRILDITEYYSVLGGGVKTYLHAKARWLSTHPDVEHTIVVPGPQTATQQIARTVVHVVTGPRVPASPGYHFLTARGAIHRLIQKLRPEVIEVGSPFLASLLTGRQARDTGSKRVLFQHSDPRGVYVDHGLRKFPRAVQRAASSVLERYLRGVYRSCDAVVVASEHGASSIRALGIEPHVIPLGVDTELFAPARRDPAWPRDIGADEGQPIGLYVGRLATEKRLDALLDALDELHRETRLLLVLIGDGHLRRGLEHLARAQPDRLRVLPYESDRAELARIYASADFFVAPGPYETFGLAAIEAMASGLPVVTVNRGAVGERLQDVAWARSYRDGDPADLVRAVGELLAADMPELGSEARTVAHERYRLESTFERLLTLYRETATGRP